MGDNPDETQAKEAPATTTEEPPPPPPEEQVQETPAAEASPSESVTQSRKSGVEFHHSAEARPSQSTVSKSTPSATKTQDQETSEGTTQKPAESAEQEPRPSASKDQQPRPSKSKEQVAGEEAKEKPQEEKQKEEQKQEDERKSVEVSTSKEVVKEEAEPKVTKVETKSSKAALKKESSVRLVDKKPSGLVSSESLEKKHGSVGKDEVTTRKSRSGRLSSKAKNVLGSTISIHRLSTTGEFFDRTKGARFMNSYKLDSDHPFNPEKVGKILESVMTEVFENLTYDPDKCPKQAKWASSAIRARVKELQFDRYKLICLVTIGEKNSQDILVSLRFLWDVDRDRYATYCIENTYVFGIAQCFGVYYE